MTYPENPQAIARMPHEAARVRRAVVLFALVVVAGALLDEYPRYVLTLWMIYSLSATGLNLILGFGKIYSLGHGGFMLVGAYGTAIAMNDGSLSPALAVAVAALAATLVGIVVGLPAIRLKHFSLAIVTFAFGMTLFQLVKSMSITGGPQGLFLEAADLQAIWEGRALWFAAAGLALAGLAVSYNLMRSRTGRALRMIAANETAARSFGIRVTFYKLAAFGLAATMGGLAGGMQALVTSVVAPETYGPDLSILMFAAVMIGGQGRLLGPFLGAAFVVLIPELTQDARALSQIVYALIFIAVVTLSPSGLLGMAESGWSRLAALSRSREGGRS